MSLITVSGLLNLDRGAMVKKAKNLFETDLRKERSPYMEGDDLRWTVEMDNGSKFGAEKMLPVRFPMQLLNQPAAPKMSSVDSYKVTPLKMTLETIEEDKPEYEKPDYLLRSKSLPTRRRTPMERNGLGLSKPPTYRPGPDGGYLPEEGGYRAEDHSAGNSSQFSGDGPYYAGDGTYFAGDGNFRGGEGGYGVSMSGPIIGAPSEYKYTGKRHRSRLSITKMREVIRHSRIREAVSHFLSRIRHSSRRSQ